MTCVSSGAGQVGGGRFGKPKPLLLTFVKTNCALHVNWGEMGGILVPVFSINCEIS